VTETSLPDAFADLAPWIGWALPNETARGQRRRDSTLDELRLFYNAISPRVVDALTYLDKFELHGLLEGERRLFELCLSYAEIAPFIEQYGRVVVPESFDERRFVPTHDLQLRGNA
jgi:hypothetical protein